MLILMDVSMGWQHCSTDVDGSVEVITRSSAAMADGKTCILDTVLSACMKTAYAHIYRHSILYS